MLQEQDLPSQETLDLAGDNSGFRPSTFHFRLLAWFTQNKRNLPWRETRDPYAIWVSEIMLQQTQVATVIPYYKRWMERFPTALALAEANDQDVLALWQGLGYYRRCRTLLEGARVVAMQGFPVNSEGWQKIKGVGRYTAAAIASIALNEAVPLVDGNVERVFARLTACDSARPELTNKAWAWAEKVLCHTRPGDWNQALMELGATVCTPNNPSCKTCPVQPDCLAHKNGLVSKLPLASQKPRTVKLQHAVWIPIHKGLFGVRQVSEGEWWAGMWEFPRSDLAKQSQHDSIKEMGDIEFLGTVRHAVTHHRIELKVSMVKCLEPTKDLKWMALEALAELPMPSPQRKALALMLRSRM
jgi:A/G-specific adenine glycosylase